MNTDNAKLVTGRFQRRPSGIGFVRPRYEADEEPSGDIFIPPNATKNAASGDTVVVEIINPGGLRRDNYGKSTKKNKRKQLREGETSRIRGRVVEILKRASNRFVGTYTVHNDWGYINVDGSLFRKHISIGDASVSNAKEGDKIVVEMLKYPTPYNDGEAVIVEVLGQHGIPGLDTQLILRQFGLPEQFGDAVLKDARKEVEKFFKKFPNDGEIDTKKIRRTKRLDLTNCVIITIDPADAKDFDDAISIEKTNNGDWRLGVHIADVSHFIKDETALDKEAKDRATSVYLPDRVIPMLPEVLSNALCSLQPEKIRYAKSVFMEFTPDGIRTSTEIDRSVIRSTQRFNYKEVQDYFDNNSPQRKQGQCKQESWKPEVKKLLDNLLELMQLLRRKRFERGSLEMYMPETKVELDDDGAVCGAHVYPYYDSNRCVEECMLAANEAVADYLAERNIPFLRRIHKAPPLRKLKSFAEFLRVLQIADVDENDLAVDRFALQKLLDLVHGSTQEYAVNFSLLRSMQKAVYSPDEEGHYALASPCYTHFTSPIRRYPDLSVHRLLDAVIDGSYTKPDQRELVLLGEHCSDREQRAEIAERELVKLKLIDYMSKRLGENIEAIITGVEHFGIFVMGTDIPAEGLIRLENLDDDFYRFEQNTKILYGQRKGNVLRIGDRLLVEVVRADVNARQIDFRLVKRLKSSRRSDSGVKPEKPPKKNKKKKVSRKTA
ncbi:MAG: ribonuclease R [Planctomycetaceae bacterium]|jgi:ribonuclease R|nr:ribonuclease R [Planctomycetaceae bacterium]